MSQLEAISPELNLLFDIGEDDLYEDWKVEIKLDEQDQPQVVISVE